MGHRAWRGRWLAEGERTARGRGLPLRDQRPACAPAGNAARATGAAVPGRARPFRFRHSVGRSPTHRRRCRRRSAGRSGGLAGAAGRWAAVGDRGAHPPPRHPRPGGVCLRLPADTTLRRPRQPGGHRLGRGAACRRVGRKQGPTRRGRGQNADRSLPRCHPGGWRRASLVRAALVAGGALCRTPDRNRRRAADCRTLPLCGDTLSVGTGEPLWQQRAASGCHHAAGAAQFADVRARDVHGLSLLRAVDVCGRYTPGGADNVHHQPR